MADTARERKVRDYYEANGECYIDQEVFNQCYGKIKFWLDVNTLVGYLMRHGLISNPAEMELISSPYYLPEQRQTNLLGLANSRGEYGFFLLYMCVKESIDENPHGHGDAVRVLEDQARRMKKQPPWITQGSYSHEESSSSSAVQPSQVVYSRGSHDPMAPPPSGLYRPTPNPPPVSGGGRGGGGGGEGRRGGGGGERRGGGGRGEDDKGASRPTTGGAVQQQRSNDGHQNLGSEKFIKYKAQQEAKHVAHQRSLFTASPPTAAPPPGQMGPGRPGAGTVLTRPPTFPGPRPQLVPQPGLGNQGGDDIIERDRARARRQAAQANTPPSLYDQVRSDVAQGAVGSLFEKFEGEVDIDVSEADCCSKSDFMDEASRFIAGSLNSRGSWKMSILLAGVSVEGTEVVITGLPSCFDGPNLAAIKSRFQDIVRSKVRVRTGASGEEQLTTAELALVKFDVVPTCPPPGPQSAHPTSDVKQVVIVAVTPNWGVCRNKLYQCRFVDASGRPKPPEVFKRSEGGTVSVRMQKLKQLESELNNAFAKLSTH